MDVMPMQMRLRTGVEMSRSQVQQVIAARRLSNIMHSELESLAERNEPGALVEAGH